MWPEDKKEWRVWYSKEELDKVFKEATTKDEFNSSFNKVKLNTQQLINSLTGKNRDFVEQIEKLQEEKYGNYDVFEVTIDELMIEIQFGEMWITFYFREDGTIHETSGTGQGHIYENWLRQVAEELFWAVRQDI